MQKGILRVLLIAGLLAGTAGLNSTLAGESSSPASTNDQWSYTLAPYIFATALDGNVGAFGLPPQPVDASFIDLLKNLDLAFMGAGEARKGRFGFFADFFFADLETESKNTPGPFFTTANVGSNLIFGTPMLEYRLVDEDGSQMDAMAGMRIWYSENDINLSGGVLNGQVFTDSEVWIDPTLGVKGRLMLADNWALNGWAIIGGFGAASDFMWDVFGGVNYAISDSSSIEFGYRGTGTDYQNGGFVFDAILHGPIIGAVFRL